MLDQPRRSMYQLYVQEVESRDLWQPTCAEYAVVG